ncbi:unnamed protein product, partial [Allacma fusca]
MKYLCLALLCSVAVVAALDDSGKYVRDDSGKYVPDDSGKYVRDDSGKYVPDNSGQYVRDNSGQYVPDNSGKYVPQGRVRRQSCEPTGTPCDYLGRNGHFTNCCTGLCFQLAEDPIGGGH